MVWPIRILLDLIQYEKALLWLWGHCPLSMLVGGAHTPPAPGSYAYAIYQLRAIKDWAGYDKILRYNIFTSVHAMNFTHCLCE